MSLPLLLFVALGVLDLGRLYYYQMAVSTAAREGARYASMFPADTDGIRQAVGRSAGQYVTIPNDDQHIIISLPGGAKRLEPAVVTVRYDFWLQTGYLVDRIFPTNPLVLERSASMMIQ